MTKKAKAGARSSGTSLPYNIRRHFQRRHSHNSSTRTIQFHELSTEQRVAWRSKASNVFDLETAVEQYRQREAFDRLHVNSFLRLEKLKRIDEYPEFCYRNEHPLRTGRKRKLYHRSDVITPILDVMTDMLSSETNDVFGFSNLLEKHRKRVKAERAELQHKKIYASFLSSVSSVSSSVSSSSSCGACSGCGRVGSKQTRSKEGLVCDCGLVCGPNIVHANRQRLGASADDDATVVADAPTQRRDGKKYDAPPPSTSEARAERLRRGAALTTSATGRKRVSFGRTCDAQAYCDRARAKEIVDNEVAAGVALHPREMVRQRNVLKELEAHFSSINVDSHAIRRLVRIKTDRLYIKSVRHSHVCSNQHKNCNARICERQPICIALSCLHYEVARLSALSNELKAEQDAASAVSSSKYDDLTGVNADALQETYSRILRNTTFQSLVPTSQLVACLETIRVLDSDDFRADVECASPVEEPEEEEEEQAEEEQEQPPAVIAPPSAATSRSPKSIGKTPSLSSLSNLPSVLELRRTASMVSNGSASPVSSAPLEARNAVLAVFSSFRSDVPILVRDAAVAVAASREFAPRLTTSDGATASKSEMSKIAFGLILALHRISSGEKATSLHRINSMATCVSSVAARLGISASQADALIGGTHAFLEDRCASVVAGLLDDELLPSLPPPSLSAVARAEASDEERGSLYD